MKIMPSIPVCLWLAVACLAGLLAARAGDPALEFAPRIVCDKPEYDFGILANTNVVKHSFILRNKGKSALIISRVRADCGCTYARVEDKRVEPGAETVLTTELTLKGRYGKQRKRITIESDDPVNRRYMLRIVGETYAVLLIRPERIFWGNIREDCKDVKEIEFIFHDKGKYRLTDISLSSTSFVYKTVTINKGESYKVQIHPVSPLPTGAFLFDVKVGTDHPQYPQVTVQSQGRVVGDIYTVPDEIKLDSAAPPPASLFVLVRSSLKQKFKVLQVEPPVSNITVKVRSLLFSGYRIELKNVSASRDLDGRYLTITTDCESMKEIKIPFRVSRLDSSVIPATNGPPAVSPVVRE